MSATATYLLQLPRSINAAVEETARSDGTSMNQIET